MGFSVQGKVALDRFKQNSQHMMLGSIPCSSDLPGSHGFDDEEKKTQDIGEEDNEGAQNDDGYYYYYVYEYDS